ncbi:MAG: hypothetical protein FWG63_06050 [Defluviitaleaceae bacterium]|nr:hypothetical protein [Defluviitaleaceae bacterium]
MATYLGYIEKKDPYFGGGSFFNYKPIYRILEGNLVELTSLEKENLLPESRQRDINFAYDYKNYEQCEAMERRFSHKKLVIFEFETYDLQDNYNNRGERNPTGYKINALELIRQNKIRDIGAEGIYNLVERRAIRSDFYSDNIILIEGDVLSSNMKVLLEIDDNIFAGPYPVDYRDLDQAYYVRPQLKENKYIISGYVKEDAEKMELSPFDGWSYNDKTWPIVKLNENAKMQKLDIITDENLLKSLRDNLSADHIKNGHIDLNDIDAVLTSYEKSIFSGSNISEEIRTERLEKLYSLLKAESDVDYTFSRITDFISDLIIKYKHIPKIDELVRIITEKEPNLLESLKEVRFIKEHMAKIMQEKEMLEADFESTKQEAFIISNFEAIAEAKAKEQLALDERYNAQKSRLREISETLEIGADVESLHNKLAYLKDEEEHLLRKQSQLTDAIRQNEEKFFELFKNAQKRLSEVSYNGLLANHLMNTAAKWNQEESEKIYQRSVNAVMEIKTKELEPNELIDYLYDTIKIVRPQYSRNEIINIAICISQGFLTVFSGAPGCGKTSICNIFAEVLGLNKIGELSRNYSAKTYMQNDMALERFISVSVERGWTSKRDFVGYYNPLTKTFDKSNRKVYDALKILHMENKEGHNDHPFLVLLDEANLSPMEYYWADFMNVCDDLTLNSHINLGEDNIFTIPETLHFVATINNDHTTETLSPRLIDRAWVVTLPHFKTPIMGEPLPQNKIKNVSWQSMKRAFVPHVKNIQMTGTVQRIYDKIVGQLKGHIHLSPRTYFAISRYCSTAAELFTEDAQYKTSPKIVALDYAIAQKVLPKINGSGENFLAWLQDFHKVCNDSDLFFSANILKRITDNGKANMNYYHFFGE